MSCVLLGQAISQRPLHGDAMRSAGRSRVSFFGQESVASGGSRYENCQSPRDTYRAVRTSAISKNSAADEIGSSQRPRMPPLKALLAFEAASRHGSFSRAAEE